MQKLNVVTLFTVTSMMFCSIGFSDAPVSADPAAPVNLDGSEQAAGTGGSLRDVSQDKDETKATEKGVEEAAEAEKAEDELPDPCVRPLQYLKDSMLQSYFCPDPCGYYDWWKAVQIDGYIDNTFTYNFNDPHDRVNSLRVFDRKDSAYLFNLLQLYIRKDSTEESRLGFATRLNKGWDADITSSYLEDNTDKTDVTEAYVSYLFDLGNENGVLVKAGKFATLAGAEVIEQKDNWNISRSFLFGYAIPFTHTGIRASHKINDTYDVTLGVVRGWDAKKNDHNDDHTYEARLGITCSEKFSQAFVAYWGPEQVDNDSNDRRLLDYVATYKFNEKLTGMVNVDIASEEGAAPDGDTAKWKGIAGYLKYECNDKLSYAARAELFYDGDGARTGTHQTLGEITLTSQYKFRENVWGRLEYRHDTSTNDVFTRNSGLSSNQNTVAASVLITF